MKLSKKMITTLEWQVRITKGVLSEYLFMSKVGGPLDQDTLRRRVWEKAMKKSDVRRRVMNNIKHTFASWALAAGENINWVAEMLGHTSTQMVMKNYGRFVPNLTHQDGSLLLKTTRDLFQFDLPK